MLRPVRMCNFLGNPAVKTTDSKAKLNHSEAVTGVVIEKDLNMTVKNK